MRGSMGRFIGKTHAMMMGIKATLEQGGKVGVVGCKNPQPILDQLKTLGIEAKAKPMTAKQPTGFIFYCGDYEIGKDKCNEQCPGCADDD